MESNKITVNETKKFDFQQVSDILLDKTVDFIQYDENRFHLIQNNQSISVDLMSFDQTKKNLTLRINGKVYDLKIEDKFDQLLDRLGMKANTGSKLNLVAAPMPGLVLDILIKAGDEVQKGDKLLILEAMKMENIIKSTGSGIIDKIFINKGDAVEKSQKLISFKQ